MQQAIICNVWGHMESTGARKLKRLSSYINTLHKYYQRKVKYGKGMYIENEYTIYAITWPNRLRESIPNCYARMNKATIS